jgi:riboflavin kinase/FMN adenylyltransferase
MMVFNSIDAAIKLKRPLVTIGTYDGVHSGHKEVIRRLVESAKDQGVDSMLITLDPHPKEALGLGNISLLSLLEEKVKLLEATDLDYLLILPFTQEFSQLTAMVFIHEYLVKRIEISGIILGYDHKFGNNREGGIELLMQELLPLGIGVEEIPAQAVDSIIVSSTKIRNALSKGNLKEANRLLGYNYAFEGKVVHGLKNGRKIGYPSANLEPISTAKLIPGKGVYAVQCCVNDEQYKGMMNIGRRPTLNGLEEVIEVHIFDFNADIYGARVRVELHEKIRDEQKYKDLNELKEQLARDEIQVRSTFLPS